MKVCRVSTLEERMQQLAKHEAQPFRKGSAADVLLHAVMLGRTVWVSGVVVDRIPRGGVSDLGQYLRVKIPGLGVVDGRLYCGSCELCVPVAGRELGSPRECAESGCATVRCTSCVVGPMEWDDLYREHGWPEPFEEFTARYVTGLGVRR